jgi:hypothetical protein
MTTTTMSTKDDLSTSGFRLKSRAAETLLTTSAKYLPELVGLSPSLCANSREFATDSRFLRCCDLLGERVLQVSSPRGRAKSDGVGTNQPKGTSMGLELVFENQRCSKQEQNKKATTLASIGSARLPARKGKRPQTIRGPLHIQCNGHGDPNYLNQLVHRVLTWPHIESNPPPVSPPNTIRVRLAEMVATDEPSAFLTAREFGRILLGAPTIYLALPLVCAHWAIVRGWAEPHYRASFDLMPAGAVFIYTPRDEGELGVCYSIFSQSYRFACGFLRGEGQAGRTESKIGKH